MNHNPNLPLDLFHPVDKIQKMFTIQKDFTKKFFKEKHNIDIDDMTPEERLQWTKEFIQCGGQELSEMLNELPWKKHRFGNQQNNLDNFFEEGIDTLKFLLNLFIINGCTPDQFYDKFIDKSNVVDIRYKQETQLQNIKDSNDKFVVFDIDGVLNNYPYNFLEYAYRHGSGQTDLKTYKHKDSKHYRDMKKQFRSTGQERNASVTAGAKEILADLKIKGYKIILLTARPYKQYSRLFSDTTIWLETNNLLYDFIFFDEKKEELLIDTFRKDQIEFIIDDDINNVNKLKEHFDNVFLVENIGVYDEHDFKYVKDGIQKIPNIKALYETYTNFLRVPSSFS